MKWGEGGVHHSEYMRGIENRIPRSGDVQVGMEWDGKERDTGRVTDRWKSKESDKKNV